jgi:protein-S-isoprenylcysteine O-methyltransferase Ste14
VLPLGDVGRYAGLVLFGAGYGVVLWATAVLGRQFSVQVTIQEGHKLVTEGPYGVVRHPRYAGIVMFLAGYGLIFLSWPALVLAAGVGAVLGWRIHDEEVLLREEFGGEWEAYARRTRRIVPWVY